MKSLSFNLWGKYFKGTILFGALLELLSFYGWALPQFNTIAFLVILGMTLVLSLHSLLWGILIIVADLVISSHGYLFSLDLGGLKLSLRIGLFMIVMSVWLFRLVQERDWRLYYKNKFFWPYIAVLVAIGWGALIGYLNGNGFNNLFFDANGYVFWLLLGPFVYSLQTSDAWQKLWQVIVGAITLSIFKVMALFYIFSHDTWVIAPEVYRWVRDTRVAEVTRVDGDFFRVFLQSQLYTSLGITLGVAMLFGIYWVGERRLRVDKNQVYLCLLIVFSSTSLLLSLSRSFWVGLVFGIGSLGLATLFLSAKKYKSTILKWFALSIYILMISFILIQGTMKFPLPPKQYQTQVINVLGERAIELKGEAALSSRWSLLPPLWEEIKANMILGAGFGKTVTYKSSDPRVVAQSAGQSGEYTTFAFEWGYLDTWLKLGLIGILIYIYFLGLVLWNGIKHIYFRNKWTESTIYMVALLSAYLIMLATNGFSPYLNHPLGIGLTLILLAYLLFVEKNKDIDHNV